MKQMERRLALTQSSSWFEQNAPDWARESATFIGNIWNDGAYGLTYGEITIAVVIIMIALMIRGLFARLIVKTIMRLASGTKSGFDDALVQSIATPLKIKNGTGSPLRVLALVRRSHAL